MDATLHEKLLTRAELARRLDISRRVLRDLERGGLLPMVHVGRAVRYVWPDVLAALRQPAADRQAVTA